MIDWSALGLLKNPFENVAPGESLEHVDVAPELQAALAQRPFFIELVGAKGAGKSTTLRWYAARHPDARYVYAAAQPLGALPWAGAAVLCLDEVNPGVPAVLREAKQRGVSLLLSSHHAHRGVTVFELERLRALGWVERRVASAALPGRAPFDFAAVARDVVPALSTVNYALLRVLYELAENLVRGAVMPAALDDAVRRARQDDTVAPVLRPRAASR